MEDPEDAPPIERTQATATVAAAGEVAARDAGLTCLTERSPNSESTYLHLLRGETWFGIRISCHEAVYDCCTDYEQLSLTDRPTAEIASAAALRIARLVNDGGHVVADPGEVEQAIKKIASVMADGRIYKADDGTRWRWSSDDEAWMLASRYWGEGEPTPPDHRPWPAVSARIRCQVRHSHNVNAKWAAESAGE